ncbi:hypothetical protein [Humidesulfovibrio sp.]|uniref:hypothetical protein n=1 Tax=Humidesulfovibrio sp. TaxID=2910988 RepID=UPI002D805023|nr:hypothetical protein [Humidesulfovibrio sp.]
MQLLDTTAHPGETARMAPDVFIAWFNAHGGAFHKLLVLHERLVAAGVSCGLCFNAGPPRGLKVGADVPEAVLPELAARGIRLVSRPELVELAKSTDARLLITDAHHDADIPGVLAAAREKGRATAQLATLLGDFTCHGADHLLIQHPLTLFFEREFNRTKESARLAEARRIYYTGNIFFEPTVNGLFGGFADRAAFCAKYGYNPARPICLWLPSAPDNTPEVYGAVCEAVVKAGVNLAVKLHPWDYALKKHGPQPGDAWGLGKPSDEVFGVRAVDEPDSTWAFKFCDVAVLRTSAMSLELPFWEQPGLLLPAMVKPKLFEAQAHMARRSSVWLSGVDELRTRLKRWDMPRFESGDYAASRDVVRLPSGGPGEGDAYARTVAAIRHILDGAGKPPAFVEPGGSFAALSRSYAPHVDRMLRRALTPRRRLRYEFSRLLRTLGC